jgi:hypothetical protein
MFLRKKVKPVPEIETKREVQVQLPLVVPPPSPIDTSRFLTQEDLNNAIESVRSRFSLDRFSREHMALSVSNQQLKLKQEAQRKLMLVITLILLVNQMIMLTVIAMH